MKSFIAKGLTLLCSMSLCHAEFNWEKYYDIETVIIPKQVDPQIGGMAAMPDGRFVACFHRGEVMIYDPNSKKWSLFAEGLHEPLGVYVEDEGTILVVQRPELTRLRDTDGDGKADSYETVCDDWGMTGNYHEFTFGLVKDSKGNIYVAHGTASNGSGVRDEIRGEWNEAGGLTHEHFTYNNSIKEKSWAVKKEGTPRMYARVPYRGCVLKITPGNRKAEVYATGLRTPNGLYMDEEDRLWVSDNQGDWVGSCKLHRIEEGGFHGHAASLLWDPKNPVTDAVPADLPVDELNARRVKSAGLFTQAECANSLSQMIGLNPNFMPSSMAKKSLLVGDVYKVSRFLRFYKDEVNGHVQGAACHVFTDSPIGGGNNRMVYSADGKSLYIGKTHLSWPGREGIKKITYKGTPYLMVESVKMTPKGFEFTFNAEVKNIGEAADYAVESFYIDYHASYGSRKNDLKNEKLAKLNVSGKKLQIELSEPLKEGYMYKMELPEGITSDLSDLSSRTFWYTAHEVLR